MTRSNDDMCVGLDNSHAPTHNYSLEDFVKIMDLKYPTLVVNNDEAS